MVNDIYSDKFWKERLGNAIKNNAIHQTVFHTSELEWNLINREHIQYINKYIEQKPGMKILDAACGYGRVSDFFNKGIEYIGIDLSSTLINEARLLYPYRSFFCCDIKQTPFLDKYFDWAIVISLKEMVVRECGQNEWDLMEKELRRIAKNIMLLEYTNGNGNEICTIL